MCPSCLHVKQVRSSFLDLHSATTWPSVPHLWQRTPLTAARGAALSLPPPSGVASSWSSSRRAFNCCSNALMRSCLLLAGCLPPPPLPPCVLLERLEWLPPLALLLLALPPPLLPARGPSCGSSAASAVRAARTWGKVNPATPAARSMRRTSLTAKGKRKRSTPCSANAAAVLPSTWAPVRATISTARCMYASMLSALRIWMRNSSPRAISASPVGTNCFRNASTNALHDATGVPVAAAVCTCPAHHSAMWRSQCSCAMRTRSSHALSGLRVCANSWSSLNSQSSSADPLVAPAYVSSGGCTADSRTSSRTLAEPDASGPDAGAERADTESAASCCTRISSACCRSCSCSAVTVAAVGDTAPVCLPCSLPLRLELELLLLALPVPPLLLLSPRGRAELLRVVALPRSAADASCGTASPRLLPWLMLLRRAALRCSSPPWCCLAWCRAPCSSEWDPKPMKHR